MALQTPVTGLFVGLLLGLALVVAGFGAMLAVAFLGAVGYLAGKVLDGDVDLSEYVGPGSRRPRR
jgi:uncharacterized membrane protein